ncbi:MAG: ABC transporter substrate-binding protein [Deltaproteobacteria bacterium]|nr:MAG: ABC transporter substrate-binding protein [Deltaproteobacteria bacterium]
MPATLEQAQRMGRAAWVLAVAVAACEGAPARPQPWRHARDEPVATDVDPPAIAGEAEREALERAARRATTLSVWLDADPVHLHPLASPTEWGRRIVMDTVFETLIRYEPSPDGPGQPAHYAPGLATAWQVGPGGRTIRVELRDGVRFHDGRAFTAVDAQFSLDAARQPRTGAGELRALLADVEAVDIVGPRALRIRLARPNGYTIRALAEVPMLSASVYRGRMAPRRGPVVGTGPYRVDRWDDGGVRLVRNSNYWGPAPAVDAIEFVRIDDAAQALSAARRGEIDVVPALIPEHYPGQAEVPAIRERFAPLHLRPPAVRYLAFGSRPPLDDPRVRAAFAMLIDRDAIAERVYRGLARPVAWPVWPGGPASGPEPPPIPYDPKRAAALLDAAGWTTASPGAVRARGRDRLHIALLALDGAPAAERDAIVAALRGAGVFVEVRRGTAAVLRNRLAAGDFDLALVEWRALVDTDLAPLFETRGRANYGRLSDEQLDALLERMRRAATPADRWAIAPAIAQRLGQVWPIAGIVAPEPVGLIARRVRNAQVVGGWLRLRDVALAEEEDAPADQ